MVTIVKSMSELKFSQLMQVYAESNSLSGAERYPGESTEIQLHRTELDFYRYLNSVFFRQQNSCYALLEVDGIYKAAFRLEPYSDGLLLCALETAPDARNKGYASALIREVQHFLSRQGSGTLYSHVSKKNVPSLTTHKNCGFHVAIDYAVYSDGSVLHNNYTMIYKYEKTEI